MALVLVLLVIAVLALLGVAGTRSAQTELQMGQKELVGRQALGAAEAGINHAYSLIKASVTGRPGMSAACTQCGFDSELSGGGTSGTLASIGSTATLGTQTYRFRAFGGGATDGYYVQAADTYDEVSGANNPAIDRDAKIYLVSRGRVGGAERVVTALVTATPLFGSYGVASKTNVNMSGGSSTDSFDSRDAAYAALTAGSHGNVLADGNISLSGGSTVIKGDATASGTVTTSGGASVTGTTLPGAPPISFPSVPACGPPYSPNAGITPSTLYTASTGVLNIQGGATGTLLGGTYCFNHITIGGGSILSVSSPVNIFVIAASDLSGGSIANTSLNASSLKLFSSLNAPSNTNGIKLSGGTQSYMSIYAPDTGITFSGGTTDFYGAVVGYNITDTGGTRFHYDQSLVNVLGPTPPRLSSWHEVRN